MGRSQKKVSKEIARSKCDQSKSEPADNMDFLYIPEIFEKGNRTSMAEQNRQVHLDLVFFW